ncbi:diguanylate cyclase [Geothrix limicola]|uniref:diguanylate cyclase n=1 Tax=Geothrix limicola TaxID=2927978 RepID=A0ABQ5QHJ4_9BACT|nr:diguanylate cyclase [Geothrix limicola]GLH73514.1 diguanylate cyclase [Geothrix limicola]
MQPRPPTIPCPLSPETHPVPLRRLRTCLCVFSLAAGLAAAPPDKVTLQLNWRHQFQFAGYYAAEAQGYFREAGLEVEIRDADPNLDAIREVVEGHAQYGVGNSSLLLARQAGQPVVTLAAIFQHSPFLLIARADSGITSIHDLVGHRVMLEPHSEELLAYLAEEGVPLQSLQVQNRPFDPLDLDRGRVDASSAFSTDDPYRLDQAGIPYLTFTPRMGGIDFYGDNLFTTDGEIRNHPARVRAFREACLRGWKYAMQHPEATADLIRAKYGRHLDRNHLLFEAHQMVPLLQPQLVEMGYMYPGRWQHIAEIYQKLGLLPAGFSMEGFLYDPGAEERRAHERTRTVLALVLPISGLFAVAALLVLHANRRQKRTLAAQAELAAAIQDSERKFRFIAEHSADVIWMMDVATQRFTYVSPSVLQLRGFTPEEVMAQPAAASLTPESAARVQAAMIETLAQWDPSQQGLPQVTEVDQPHKDGHLVPTEVVTTFHGDAEGRPLAVLGVTRDITARRRIEAQRQRAWHSLEQLASTDLLTGAWNRRHFEEAVEAEMHRARRHGHALSLLLLDIDHFKRVNDTYGHPEGDRVLRQVADCIRAAIRQSDSLTRWGGEEFIVLMPETDPASAMVLAERIREGIAGHHFEGIGTVTASLGVAEYLPFAPLETWLERADQAMYQAKRKGRNRVEADPARSRSAPVSTPSGGVFLKLVWSDTYHSGQARIDAEHEHLFRTANGLLDLILAGAPAAEVQAFARSLLSEVAQHFQDEEAILKETAFSGLPAHAEKHANLLAKGLELEQAYRSGALPVDSLFQFVAHDVIAQHMLKADKEFFPLFGSRG